MAVDTRQAAIYFPTRSGLDPDLGEDASETEWSENLIPGIGGTPDQLEMRPNMRIAGRLPSPLPGRSSHASVLLNNVFYVFGGRNGSGGPMGDVWSSPDGENWTMVRLIADWPPRYGHSVAVLSGVMYLMGGYNGTIALHDVWKSTDNGVTWTLVDDGTNIPWVARYYHRSGTFSGNIYVIAGRNASTNVFADVWVSPDGLNWILKETGAFVVRHSHSIIIDSSKIWVLGGETSPGVALNDAWYSTDSGATWTEATASAAWDARFGHVSVEVSNELWVAAGEKETGALPNDVWVSSAISSPGVTWVAATTSAAFSGRAYATLHVKGSLMYLICGLTASNITKNEVWTSPNGADWTLITPAHHMTGAPTRGDLYLIQPVVGSGGVSQADYVMLAACSTASSTATTLDAFPQISGGDIGDIDPGNSPY